jgi:RNA polymerase sigma factor for flagellar operon FliA
MPPNVEVDDLIQSGMIGLLDAAKHYSRHQGRQFRNLCGHPHPRRHARRGAQVRLDAALGASKHARDGGCGSQDRERQGQDATPTDIAEGLGVSIEEYHKLVQDAASCRLFSFDQMGTSDDESSPADHARDERPGPFDHIEDAGFAMLWRPPSTGCRSARNWCCRSTTMRT